MTRRAAVVGAVALVVLIALVAVAVWLFSLGRPENPTPGTKIVASTSSQAHRVAADAVPGSPAGAAARYLSEQPTAIWLTPEAFPLGEVSTAIADFAAEAREQEARLAVVVYGLPARDCGNHSSGGLPAEAYAEWTTAIGTALRTASDVHPIVILEPDSLALAPECGNVPERVEQLTAAVAALAADTTTIYLDGGHSNWLPAAEMAALIDQVGGQEHIRGFTTNVSNFNRTDDEVAYAHAVAGHLNGMHAIIDTSRNGAGSNGEWCNPPGRLIGESGGTIGDDVVDTNLWIKVPGESDGTCHGGPAAGVWWPRASVELTRYALGD